jgi:hypothetical protein
MTRLGIVILGFLMAACVVALLLFREHLQARMREKDEALLRQFTHFALLPAYGEKFEAGSLSGLRYKGCSHNIFENMAEIADG